MPEPKPPSNAGVPADPARHAAALFREAAASTRDLVYDWHVRENTIEWFGGIDAALGFAPGTFPRTIEGWEDVLHPNDRAATLSALSVALESDAPFAVSYRVIRQTGEVRYWRERGRRLLDASGRVERFIGACTDITEEVTAREALERRERVFRAVFEGSHDGMTLIDDEYRYVLVNPALERMLHMSAADLIGRRMGTIAGSFVTAEPVDWNDLRRLGALRAALTWTPPGGTPRELDIDATAYVLPDLHLVVMRDVTDERRAAEALVRTQDQLRQAQKMEAVGQLAGGVAHDFNNLLSVILGYSDMLSEALPPEDPVTDVVNEIKLAATRGASLTRQLLAFSRKQVLQPRPVRLGDIVARAESLLRRLIGEDIALSVERADGAGVVMADAGQIEQVVMNLAVNARDAMPDGGRLTIETRDVDVGESGAGLGAVPPGRYVTLTMSDTGVGMDDTVLSHLFEPFFTTKAAGHGTGLGLSTVYGIVEQSGGHITAASVAGAGTTFCIYLPRVEARPLAEASGAARTPASAGNERILLVEDDQAVGQLVERLLSAHGYDVTWAQSAEDALGVVARDSRFDLIITDVVMPGLSGRALVDRLYELVPGARVMYMSGYTADAIVRHGVLEAQVEFLQKPFTVASLTARVREVLDRSGGQGGSLE